MAKEDKRSKEIIATARTRLNVAIAALSSSREDEIDDLRFFAGSPDNQWQWPADVLSTRGAVQGQAVNARPTLTINKLPQHVRQVTNDQRQNRPSGKVIPADDKGDLEVAEIYDGMVRHIEYISDADVVYDTACENQVAYGEGYFRVLTEYCSEDSFDQEIKLGRIRNSFSVYMDPMIQDPCGSDANWCFITEDVLKDEYEKKYPEFSPISTLEQLGVGDKTIAQWISSETIRIAEYFYYEIEYKTLNLYPGGVSALEGSQDAREAAAAGFSPIRTRKVEFKKVKWIKTNGYEILEERDWAGKWIPVIRVVGNEFEVEGELHVSGLVRNAKDAQRMYNYWVSQEAEMLALAPKAPFVGYGGQFEGYEQQWKTANTTNWPYLEVNADVTDGNGSPMPLPQRSQPPMAQNGLIQAKMGAADDIKATTGQYDSSIGAQSNERSGVAINARDRQADTGTYHYGDNLSRGIRYGTRQIVDLIPKIYDTARIARIIGEDGQTKSVKINPNQQEPVTEMKDDAGIVIEKIYNPGVGKYDVCVTTGPSYMTKRQEAKESMTKLLQGNPELWKVGGDLFIKNMDWPGAQEMAKRFARTIDPKILEGSDDSPEMQAAKLQMQAMGQEMDQMHNMLQNIQNSFEARDTKVKEFEAQVKAFDAQTKRIAALEEKMTPEQIQDIVMGTIHAAIDMGDLNGGTQEDLEEGSEAMEESGGTEQPQLPGMEPPEQPQPEGM